MIHIKIIDSSDLLAIGEYQFHLPRISIGSSPHSNIIIEDNKTDKNLCEIRHLKDKLTIDTAGSYLLNGKKTRGLVSINKSDEIQINSLKFKIIEFDNTNLPDTDTYYDYLNKIKEESPAKYELLMGLEEHYIKLTGYYDNEFLD